MILPDSADLQPAETPDSFDAAVLPSTRGQVAS